MQQTYEQSLWFILDIMLLKTPIETLFQDDNSATEVNSTHRDLLRMYFFNISKKSIDGHFT